MINPVVTARSEKTCEYEEGCLSIPDLYATVTRPESITVEYYDENLEKVSETFDKFACRMVEHELQHLDGHMFVDIVSPIRKKMISRKLKDISLGKKHARYATKIK